MLDSTAFIEWSAVPKGELFVPPKVAGEAKSLESTIKIAGIQLKQPNGESVVKVKQQAAKTGDSLSPADADAVALAMDLKAILVSDDYAAQNVAAFLGIKFLPLSKPGIKKKVIWGRKCSQCGRWLVGDTCEICGGKARKAVREAFPL